MRTQMLNESETISLSLAQSGGRKAQLCLASNI